MYHFDLKTWVAEGKTIRWQLVMLNCTAVVQRSLQGKAGFCTPRVPEAVVPEMQFSDGFAVNGEDFGISVKCCQQ